MAHPRPSSLRPSFTVAAPPGCSSVLGSWVRAKLLVYGPMLLCLFRFFFIHFFLCVSGGTNLFVYNCYLFNEINV
jgi:hypothetical protein